VALRLKSFDIQKSNSLLNPKVVLCVLLFFACGISVTAFKFLHLGSLHPVVGGTLKQKESAAVQPTRLHHPLRIYLFTPQRQPLSSCCPHPQRAGRASGASVLRLSTMFVD
jgi:hypothetical protein